MREFSAAGERLLYRVMSGLSEEHWCAGWLTGCEYALWADLTGKETCSEKGWGISDEEKAELQLAHTVAGGWIVWFDKAEQLIFHSDAEWLAYIVAHEARGTRVLHDSRDPLRHLPAEYRR